MDGPGCIPIKLSLKTQMASHNILSYTTYFYLSGEMTIFSRYLIILEETLVENKFIFPQGTNLFTRTFRILHLNK